MNRANLALLFTMLCSGIAFSQQEFVAFEFNGTRSRVNLMTGEKTSFGTVSGFSSINAAAGLDGVIYVGGFNGVARINAATGTATSLLSGHEIRGLAFLEKQLCAIREQPGNDQFVSINRTTGALALIGSTGFGDIQALTTRPNGSLLGWSITFGLVTINPLTGAATDVGPAIGPPIQSLEFDSDGALFGIDSSNHRMYQIDPATGAATYLYDVQGDIRGLAPMGPNVRILACGPGGNYEIDASTGRAYNMGGATRSWKSFTYDGNYGDIVGIDGLLWHYVDQGDASVETGVPLTHNFKAIAHNPTDPGQDLWGVFDGAVDDTLYGVNSPTGIAQPIGPIGFNAVVAICYGDFQANRIYGWDRTAGLITISGSTGAGTDVNASVGGTSLIHSLVSIPDGPIYGVGTNRIYSIDRTSGAWYEIGGTLFTNVTAATWMPGYARMQGVNSVGTSYSWLTYHLRGFQTGAVGSFGSSNSSCATLQGLRLIGGQSNTLKFVDPLGNFSTQTFVPAGGFGPRGLAELNGVIYAIRDATPSDRLERYDPETNSYSLVGATGFTGLQALATSPSGRLLAWDVTGPGLVRIDPTTGIATDVNPAIGSTGANIQTLEFTPDGRLYGAGDRLYLVDPASGFAGIITNDVLGDVRGLAYLRTNVRIEVTREDYSGSLYAKPITMELRRVGTTTVVETMTAAFANFQTFGTNRVGTFDIAVKGPHWLRKVIPNVTIHWLYETQPYALSLVNGDCDGDNEVGIGDYAVLSAAYGTAPGDPAFDANCDLNGDEAVDIGDFSILSVNFGLMGED